MDPSVQATETPPSAVEDSDFELVVLDAYGDPYLVLEPASPVGPRNATTAAEDEAT